MSQNKKWQKCPECGKKTLSDKQFCQHCLYNIGLYYSEFSFNIGYKPKWVGTYNNVNPNPEAMDANGERRAVEIMLSERKKEMGMSERAARWERGRKAAWKNNGKYIKARKRKHKRELQKAKKIAKEFLSNRAKKNKRKKTK